MLRRLLVATLLALATTAQAETPEAALSRFLDGVQTFEAGFTQVQTDEKGRAEAPSVGQMALARPGRFRWEYQAPNTQLIVTDGSTLWLYDEDLKQVTVRPAAEALAGTPAALLSQKKTLTEAFTLSDDGSSGEIRKLKLTPKAAESDFKDVSLCSTRPARRCAWCSATSWAGIPTFRSPPSRPTASSAPGSSASARPRAWKSSSSRRAPTMGG